MRLKAIVLGLLTVLGATGLAAQIGTGQSMFFSDGGRNPKAGVVNPGATDAPAMQTSVIVLSISSADITSISVDNTGTATSTDFDQLKLWEDSNGNGAVDAGEPLHGTAASGKFPVAFTLSSNISVPSAGINLLVTIDVSSTAAAGATFAIQLDPINHVTVSPNIGVGGGPITGGDQTVNAVPTSLNFVTQPAGATAGSPFTSQPSVEVLDQSGNRMTGINSGSMVASLSAGPSATLGGTLGVTPVAGLVDFTDLQIDTAGTGFKITVTAGPLTGESNAFDVLHGTPAVLSLVNQPGSATAGDPLSPQPSLQVLDTFGNLCDTDNATSVTATLSGGTAGATLGGTATVTAVSGSVDFTDLSVDTSGIDYTLDFAAAGLTGASSTTFDITSPNSGSPVDNGGGDDDGDSGCVANSGATWIGLLALIAIPALALRRRHLNS